MSIFDKTNSKYFCAGPTQRDKRLGKAVDWCWLQTWFKIHSFYQILITVWRSLTIKDIYTLKDSLQNMINGLSKDQVGVIIFWKLALAWLLSMIAAGLSMGCTQTLSNIVNFVGNSSATSSDQKIAYLQMVYYIVMFILRVYISEHSSRLSMMSAIKIQQILCFQIFKKLTVVSNCFKKHLSKGELIALFRIQTRTIYSGVNSSSVLVSAPTTLILSQIFLCIRIGNVGLVMLPVMLSSLAIQLLISFRVVQISNQKQEYYQQRLANNLNYFDQIDEIKILGWESVIIQKNRLMRKRQNKLHFIYYLYLNIYASILVLAPCLTMLIYILTTLYYNNIVLSSRRAYTVYSFINQIINPLRTLPQSVVFCMQAYDAIKRLNNFFTAEQITNHQVSDIPLGKIIIENYVASIQSQQSLAHLWTRASLTPYNTRSLSYLIQRKVGKEYIEAEINHPQFKYFNLMFKDISVPYRMEWSKGDRVIILTMDVGFSNQILKCFLGELKTQQGSLKYNGKLGYIMLQEMLFMRQTAKNNIIFQQKEDLKKLQLIYDALDLKSDFIKLQKGQDTIMDDSNLVFSLTDRKKIALARCLYADTDILLLDRFFESMEADKASYLYDLYSQSDVVFKTRTVFMTCKQTYYLKPDDKILIMRHGQVIESGIMKNLLMNNESKIHSFSSRYVDKIVDEQLLPKKHKVMNYMNSIFAVQDHHAPEQKLISSTKPIQPRYMTANGVVTQRALIKNVSPSNPSATLGVYMQWRHYKELLQIGGYFFYFVMIMMNAGGMAVRILSDWWIGTYSLSLFATNNAQQFIIRYSFMIIGVMILLFLASILSTLISIRNTEGLLNEMTQALLYSDTEAMKRVNKVSFAYDFSKDNEDVFKINYYFQIIFRNILLFLGTIIFMGIVSWITVVVGLSLFIFNIIVMYYYRKAQMELYSISVPLRSQYSKVIENIIRGARTIRTLNKIPQFQKMLIDTFYVRSPVIRMNSRFTSHGLSIFGSYVALLTTVIITLIAISKKFNLSATQITLVSTSISMSTRLSGFLSLVTKDFASFANATNLAVKVMFDKLTKVYPIIKKSVQFNRTLPKQNSIEVKNLYQKSDGTKLYTLSNVNFYISSHTNVALYGNINGDIEALFKIMTGIIKPDNQNQFNTMIKIGGLNIKSLSSKQLSKIMMILSSDPLILTGTLRQNIDPFNQHFDEHINFALEQVEFWYDLSKTTYFCSQPNFGRLDFLIDSMGIQLPTKSVQKINIARAIIRKPSIVFYLNSFRSTPIGSKDRLRQILYRNLPKSTTILMATLNLYEMMKCDYLIGFHKGVVIEQGKPSQLVLDAKNRISKIVDIVAQKQYLQNKKNKIYRMFAYAIQEIMKQTRPQIQ